MRDIHTYTKIVKLLKSPLIDDLLLGMELVKTLDFTADELDYNFPHDEIPSRDFKGNCDTRTLYKTPIKGAYLCYNNPDLFYFTGDMKKIAIYEEI